MYHSRNGAYAVERIEAVNSLRRIGHTNGYGFSFFYSESFESLCGSVDFFYEFCISRSLTLKFIGIYLRMGLACVYNGFIH